MLPFFRTHVPIAYAEKQQTFVFLFSNVVKNIRHYNEVGSYLLFYFMICMYLEYEKLVWENK